MQASPQQLPLLAMSSPHCLEEIAATGLISKKPKTSSNPYHNSSITPTVAVDEKLLSLGKWD